MGEEYIGAGIHLKKIFASNPPTILHVHHRSVGTHEGNVFLGEPTSAVTPPQVTSPGTLLTIIDISFIFMIRGHG